MKEMTRYFVAKKIILFSCWKILNFSHFDGLKLNLLFFPIHFIVCAKALFYV